MGGRHRESRSGGSQRVLGGRRTASGHRLSGPTHWSQYFGRIHDRRLYLCWLTFVGCCIACSEDTYPVRVVGVWSQVEITRTLREGLRIGSSSGSGDSSSGLLTPVTLSPALSPQGLPTVVDSVKTVWPRNPFDPLPPGEGSVGGVLEYTLRDGASGAVVGLPPVTSSTAGLPMHFLVAIGKLVARPMSPAHACTLAMHVNAVDWEHKLAR
jgi:hypothetical protein